VTTLPCPVCKGVRSHAAACSVPVLGLPERCTCNPAEVEDGVCVLCGKPFPVGGSV
jgi:hypothetical protein